MATLHTPPASASLLAQLNQLEQADLIRLASAAPDLAYLFRHALINECAYHTLVRADRRRLHRAAGEALEALLDGREPPPELAPQLARHFEEAGNYPRALHYYALAGDAALAGFANTEAIAAFGRALAAAERAAAGAERSPLSTAPETWRHLFEANGRALELNGQFAEALANYEAMEQRGRTLGDRRLALAAQVAAGQLFANITPLFDPQRAEQMAEAALAEARALGDEAAEAKILWNQLNLNRLIQRQPQARAAGERSLAIARRLGLRAQAAYSVHDLAHVYADMGLWAESEQASLEARQTWRALGNSAMLADNLTTSALYHGLSGRFGVAVEEAGEAHRMAVAIGNQWGQAYSLLTSVWPHWHLGRPDRAVEAASECVRAGAGVANFAQVSTAWKGFIYAELGDMNGALECMRRATQGTARLAERGVMTVLGEQVHLELRAGNLAQARSLLEIIDTVSFQPAIFEVDARLRARSEVALALGEPAAALSATQAHVAGLRERGLWLYLPEALCGLAQAWMLGGQPAEARAALAEALERAQAMDAVWVEWQARYALGRLDIEQGDAASGRRQWARAREIVAEISAHIPTAALRQSFRARAEVRAMDL